MLAALIGGNVIACDALAAAVTVVVAGAGAVGAVVAEEEEEEAVVTATAAAGSPAVCSLGTSCDGDAAEETTQKNILQKSGLSGN